MEKIELTSAVKDNIDAITNILPDSTLKNRGITPLEFGNMVKSANDLNGKLWRISGTGAYILIHSHPIHTAIISVYQSQSENYPKVTSNFLLKDGYGGETLIYKDDKYVYLHGVSLGGTKTIILALGSQFYFGESSVDTSTLTRVF